MILRYLVLVIFFGSCLYSQEAIHNFGTLRMHNDMAMGFHTDFINNGNFTENSGLAGFYGYDKSITVNGSFTPVFEDMEIMVDNDLFLETSIQVSHNVNYITGNLVTPREIPEISLIYDKNSFYVGAEDFSKTDGYVTIYDTDNFVFPIGVYDRLRPLSLVSEKPNPIAKSAYFFLSPDAPMYFANSFDTDQKVEQLKEIGPYEFWVLKSEIDSKVVLSWDAQSRLSQFVDKPKDIRVVGWHKTDEIWHDLGNTEFSGDLTQGEVTSGSFLPNNYAALTFGTGTEMPSSDLANYLLTPNDDGSNDYLFLEAIKSSPKNHLNIYNRWGRLVYSQENYQNTFNGTSNVKYTITKDKDLPDGTYFYVIQLFDQDKVHQGYLYINH